jgi:SNF2 family DNA or RNA helicase
LPRRLSSPPQKTLPNSVKVAVVHGHDPFVFAHVCVSDAGELRKALRPFLLRRLKTDVLPDFPELLQIILYTGKLKDRMGSQWRGELMLRAGMSEMQKKYYRMVLEKDAASLVHYPSLSLVWISQTAWSGHGKSRRTDEHRVRPAQGSLSLSLSCCGCRSRSDERRDRRATIPTCLWALNRSRSRAPLVSCFLSDLIVLCVFRFGLTLSVCSLGEHIVLNSGKMVVLDKLLRKLRADGRRVLVPPPLPHTIP